MSDTKRSIQLPNCRKCIHYWITHDPQNPFGCRAMRFKSRVNPAQLVYETSGIACQLFKRKKSGGNGGCSSIIA